MVTNQLKHMYTLKYDFFESNVWQDSCTIITFFITYLIFIRYAY